MRNFWGAVIRTFRLFGSDRKLWLPFAITAIVEAVLLGVLWIAPQPPFSKLFAPPLRYFYGDQILHYPLHLYFLYHAMRHTRLIAATLIGAFMTGVACDMVRQLHVGQRPTIREALIGKRVRFGRVVILWLISWGLAIGVARLTHQHLAHAPWVPWAGVAALLLLQSLVAYAIPIAVFTQAPWWRALLRSAWETLRFPLTSSLLVALPTAPLIVFAYFARESSVAEWMHRTTPEAAFAFITGRLLLWTICDAVMTVGVASLWLLRQSSQPAAAARASRRPGLTPLVAL